MNYSSYHKFHIPVMGLAFTIDSPIKVARFGISSVISIVEDRLIELMRKQYYPTIGLEYFPITTHEKDFRAKRITDYLNLVNKIVQSQVERLKNAAFDAGSEIVKYFEMLPDDSKIKQLYLEMMNDGNQQTRKRIEDYLRTQIRPGSIDVNIMTKADRDRYNKRGEIIENYSDAIAALRGYANSELADSSVVFSAGMNPRLYNYLEHFNVFDANENGEFTKKITVKVSDYRSAFIQGKYLAKKGIWVSEFRIESGLNCGGHAFATDGYLMGPILEEFKVNKQALIDSLFEIYKIAIQRKNNIDVSCPPKIIISTQGGIGTYEEDLFLHRQYNIESTGWGTPFLLVPEATTVDDETLKLLCEAKSQDVVLSRNSPLGVRFFYLKGTSADNEKQLRINKGRPGSPCTEKHLAFNTEFTKEPICTASYKYQKLKIAQLASSNLEKHEYDHQLGKIQEKECLCIGLSNSAALKYNQIFINNLSAVTICPGPNIINFSKVVSLQTMVDHIYGRKNLHGNINRHHMFITELRLYIDYLKEQLSEDVRDEQFSKKKKYYDTYYNNLRKGIRYYRQIQVCTGSGQMQFVDALNFAEEELDLLKFQFDFIDNE